MSDEGFLGNVENGWFAQVAHFGEGMGRFLGLGGVYENMEKGATQRIEGINNSAYNAAIAQGKTPIQAHQAANGELGKYSNPHSANDFGNLLASGAGTARDAVFKALSPDNMEAAAPLLLGAGLLGAGYLVADAFTSSSPAPTPAPRIDRSVS